MCGSVFVEKHCFRRFEVFVQLVSHPLVFRIVCVEKPGRPACKLGWNILKYLVPERICPLNYPIAEQHRAHRRKVPYPCRLVSYLRQTVDYQLTLALVSYNRQQITRFSECYPLEAYLCQKLNAIATNVFPHERHPLSGQGLVDNFDCCGFRRLAVRLVFRCKIPWIFANEGIFRAVEHRYRLAIAPDPFASSVHQKHRIGNQFKDFV